MFPRTLTKAQQQIAIYSLLFIVAVIGIPALSDGALDLLDHAAIRVVLIAAVLFAVSRSAVAGVAVLLLVGLMLLERNARKMSGLVIAAAGTPAAVPRMQEDADMPVAPSLRYVAPVEPDASVMHFTPQEDTGSDVFVPVDGATLNAKFVPADAPRGEAAAALF
jgi:hypothetical protein